MLFARGYLVPFAAHMKRHLRIPVVAVGRINDPELAENILRKGDADLIGFGRGLLADPDLPLQAERGQFDDIRRCVACNECMSLAFSQKDVACLINPELSREGMIDMSLTRHRKRVLVVGAGPAGIQAALTASQKGHSVVLCERDGWLGGKLPLVGAPPGKEEFADYLRYLRLQIAKSPVEVRLNTLVTPELVNELRPDVVMLASGALPQIPDIPGVHGSHVFTAEDALHLDIPGRRIVVLGASGTGCETAQYLRQRGPRCDRGRTQREGSALDRADHAGGAAGGDARKGHRALVRPRLRGDPRRPGGVRRQRRPTGGDRVRRSGLGARLRERYATGSRATNARILGTGNGRCGAAAQDHRGSD